MMNCITIEIAERFLAGEKIYLKEYAQIEDEAAENSR